MAPLQERDQFLPDLAPEIPGAFGVGGAGEGTNFERAFLCVGHLQHVDLAVPQW